MAGKWLEYEKMYAVLCGAVDTALELIEQNADTRQVTETLQAAPDKAEKHVHRRLMKKIRCPTGERQRILWFLLQYTAD